MTNNNYSTHLSSYRESAALQQLLEAIDSTASIERFNDDVLHDQFTITIGGQQIAFFFGGPQIAALHAFVRHIANENLYTVDLNRSTVTE